MGRSLDFSICGAGGVLEATAVRLRHGHTLISDQYNHRVIEVNHAKHIVHTRGQTRRPRLQRRECCRRRTQLAIRRQSRGRLYGAYAAVLTW